MILQFLINGLITGVLYSLLAIGFALVYNTTKVFHIAAAAIYVVAAYAFYTFTAVLGFPLPVAGLFSVGVTMFVSWGTEMLIYRSLKRRKASLNVMMIASIGLMTILVNVIAMFYGNETKVIDNVIQKTYTFGELIITTPQMYQWVIGSVVLTMFMLVLAFSRYGLRLRALSADETLFETLGYNTNGTRSGVFVLSGAFIALASCLTVYDVGLDPHMGMNVLINAMVAMIIGGVGRFGTCILGGVLLGVLQAVVVYLFASNWQNAITFVGLILFLFFRPQGIAGYKQRTV